MSIVIVYVVSILPLSILLILLYKSSTTTTSTTTKPDSMLERNVCDQFLIITRFPLTFFKPFFITLIHYY